MKPTAMDDTELEEIAAEAVREASKHLREDDSKGGLRKLLLPVLVPVLTALIGSALTFVVSTESNSARQAAELKSQSEAIHELKDHAVSKEVFNATVDPMARDIADIRQSVSELRKEEKANARAASAERVIYKAYSMASYGGR